MVVGLWSSFAFVTGVYGGLVAEPPAWFAVAASLAVYVAVYLWMVGDSRRHRDVAEQYGGFGLFVLWPVLLPVYVIQTRGLRRAVRIFALVLLIGLGAVLAGFAIGRIIPHP